MAKAIYGHLGQPAATLAWENARLRSRVADLEAELQRVTLELEAYRAAADPIYDLEPSVAEDLRPALT